MTVAIVHYHLQPGGVTRVIEAQSRALHQRGIPHVVLAGSPYEGPHHVPFRLLPELFYRDRAEAPTPEHLAAAMRAAATDALGTRPEIWHVHNPALGKNLLFPEMLQLFTTGRHHMVWQHHDFAEDGRPGNYREIAGESRLYPVAPQVRHTFINSRDRHLLIDAGLPAEHTALLPNAVTVAPAAQHRDRDTPRHPDYDHIVLYPVRGIRRKNLGELCLLAGLAPERTVLALTLAPQNPEWREIYRGWESFARSEKLPVEFGAVGRIPPGGGDDSSYEAWQTHATHLVTTSIAEGFGLAFLEPIALRKPLFGRDLPDITADFKTGGLSPGDLYDHILVPAGWIDPDRLAQRLRACLQSGYRSFRRPFTESVLEDTMAALDLDGFLDFGNLPEDIQQETALRAFQQPGEILVTHNGVRRQLRDWLRHALDHALPGSDPAALEPWSLPTYGERLAALYQDVHSAQTASPAWLDKGKVLDQFLLPGRFHFLRT